MRICTTGYSTKKIVSYLCAAFLIVSALWLAVRWAMLGTKGRPNYGLFPVQVPKDRNKEVGGLHSQAMHSRQFLIVMIIPEKSYPSQIVVQCSGIVAPPLIAPRLGHTKRWDIFLLCNDVSQEGHLIINGEWVKWSYPPLGWNPRPGVRDFDGLIHFYKSPAGWSVQAWEPGHYEL